MASELPMASEQAVLRPPQLPLIVLGAGCAAVDCTAVVLDHSSSTASSAAMLLYMLALVLPLSSVRVRLPRGYLTLGALVTNTAVLAFAPRNAALAGLGVGAFTFWIHRRVVSVPVLQAVILSATVVIGSGARIAAAQVFPAYGADIIGIVAATVGNLALTGLLFSLVVREPFSAILKRNLNRHWIGAFAYFGVAAIVISNLLDGSLRGYVLATLVAILSLALADSVAGREIRVRLQRQLDDADRYLAYSRIVEGTIHNVRNHLAASLGHLEEMPLTTDPAEREHRIDIATSGVHDAVEALNLLHSGASPKLEWSAEPIDLTVLARDGCSLSEPRGASKRVHLTSSGPKQPVLVNGDPLLLRQVVTNLVFNAIDAVATGGHVRVETGERADGAYLSVIDDGPGVPDKFRDRLFEPHFTTKANGTGIGLFVSYGIVKEHRGLLLYEGSKRGAIFTIVLEPARPRSLGSGPEDPQA